MIKELLAKFSTKKDAIAAIDLLILEGDADKWSLIRDEVEKYKDEDLATEVLNLLNAVFGTSFTDKEQIKRVINQRPKTQLIHFESVIRHRYEI